MKLIGLAGRAGTGKDTLAGLILECVTGHQRAFADPLRRAAREIFGLTQDQMTDRVLKEQVIPYWNRSPRQLLQLLGTEAVRDIFGPDTWVKRAELTLESLLRVEADQPLPADVVIYTDCRFADEARWVRSLGGIVIEIMRPGVSPVASHSSEQALPRDLVDVVLANDGSINQLRRRVIEDLPGWLDRATPVHQARKGRAA